MSADVLASSIAVVVSGVLGSLIGFYWGWRCGRKYGEADGVAWAAQRLEEARQQMQRNPTISANDEGLDGIDHSKLY